MNSPMFSKYIFLPYVIALGGLLALPAMALAAPSGVMGPKNAPNLADQTAPAASFTSNGETVALDGAVSPTAASL